MNLNIAGFDIKRDSNGRYCLNDFHKAAGGEAKHAPNRFSRTDGFLELVKELTPEMALAPAVTLKGGSTPGTFVCKELVYAYAMWVSPKFHLHVIRTYDQAVLAEMAEHRRVTSMALQVANMKLEVATKQVELVEEQMSYMTLQQYRAMTGVKWPRKMNSSLGLLLTQKCTKHGLEVRSFDQNGWLTNSYPTHILDELVEDYGLERVRLALPKAVAA